MVITPKNHFQKHKFVDREGHIQTFTEAVKKLGQKELNVLVYYGVAGIGKTSLRKELPKYLEEYNLEDQHPEVIWASIDLQLEKHREKTTFLVTLKNELQKNLQGRRKINFPAFEIAHAIYWKKANPEIPLRKENYLFFKGDNFIDDFFGTVDQIPYAQVVPAIARALKNVPDYLRKWWKIKGEAELSQLSEMEALEIEETLPYFWAQDLENYLEHTSESAVIFIDTYEALWENHRSEGNSRDEWIREELIRCSPKNSLWVICGREKLRWEKSNEKWKNCLNQYEVEELLRKYCMEYLNDREITDKEIQEAIFKGSKGIPYYLELSVYIYNRIKESRKPTPEDFDESQEKIAARFFRFLSSEEKNALNVLSVPRFWDYDLFKYLVTEFNTGYPTNDYEDLCSFSFIGKAENDKLQMHQLMQKCLQNTQKKKKPDAVKRVHKAILEFYSKKLENIDIKAITPEHENALTEAFYHAKEALGAEELFNWFISVSDPFLKAAYWKLNLPLYEEILQMLEKSLFPTHPYVCTILNNLAGLYENIGNYGKALSIYQKVLDIREKTLGIEHLDVGNSLNNLAALQYRLGNYREALHNYQKALNISEKILGSEHPSIAITLNNLGELHKTGGNYKEAFSLYQRALDIRKKKLVPEHPSVAINLSTLAGLYKIYGNYNKALPLYQSAIKIFENVYGSGHPYTAKTLSSLAGLYNSMGEYEKAISLYQSVLKTFEQVYGPEHPETAKILDDLSILYSHIGKYKESLTLNQRALRIFEGSLGKEHIDFATSLNNSAMIYKNMGDYQKALLLYQETLDIVENALGKEHLYVATTLNNLAMVYEHLGNYKKALPLYQRALTIREKVLGSDHQEVAQTLNNLASLHRSAMNYEKALPLYKRSIEIAEKKLGEENDFTATMYNNLAELYRNMGNYEAALPLYQKSLKIFEIIFGIEHPKIATILNNLATLYCDMKKYEEALPYCQQAFKIRNNVLEEQHPEIGITLNNLAGIYCQMEKYDEAIPLFEQALNIFENKLGSEHPYYVETMNNLTALCSRMTKT